MFAKARSIAVVGMDGYPVEVEVQCGAGLPSFTVVGLGDAAVQEARERVRAAVVSSGEKWPANRITVNLSPAHLPKVGSGYDLAIALAILAANERVPARRLESVCAVGELSLDGRVRRVRGVLASVMAATEDGIDHVLVPKPNASEGALVPGAAVIGVESLRDAAKYLRGELLIDPACAPEEGSDDGYDIDLSDVRGHATAKSALEIAAAGGHNIFMRGVPGAGKTMLARRLPSILPPLSLDEAMEVTRIYSVAGLLSDDTGLMRRRPFRAPHHSVSTAGLVGGGSGIPSPGEVSLAHRGVLFLDEAGEFKRDGLQALRQPVEDGYVRLKRAKFAVTYPASFQLVLATNPCPCGYFGDLVRSCDCRPGQISGYRERLSGPLLDRIDLSLDVPRLTKTDIFMSPPGEESAVVSKRVTRARERQLERLGQYGIGTNAEIPVRLLNRACLLTRAAKREIEEVQERMALSMRATHRLMRVARTMADLAADFSVTEVHVKEASNFRLDEQVT